MDTSPASTTPDRLPDWLGEALDVLLARRRPVVATAVGLVLLGAIVALVAPSILPPRAVVGAAVGVAAALLSTALALALDASDLIVRGARHVRAAGGTVDVRVGRQHDDVGPLLAAVSRHAGTGPLRVALAPASRSAGVPGARAAALAEALARTGRKVLLIDVTRGGSPAAGLSDVIVGARTLSEVVRFEQELYLARLAVGSDPDVAIRGFAGWVEGLPSDLEVLVAALPPLAEPGVLAASASLDATFVLVEVDRTERVDLIASLDAVDAANLACEVVLVDPERTAALAPTTADEAARSVEADVRDEGEPAPDDELGDVEPPDEAAPAQVAGASGSADDVGPAADATAEIDVSSLHQPAVRDDEPPHDGLAGIWADPGDDAVAQDPQPWIAPRQQAPREQAPREQAPPAEAPREQAPPAEDRPDADEDTAASPAPRMDEPPLDDAALQAARTSAALQQLAQQIWERDER